MTTILSAGPIVSSRMEVLETEVKALKKQNITPKMAVILVGNDPASLIYVSHKERKCKKIGCEFELIHLNEDVEKEKFLSEVDRINNDPSIHGCFAQLPLPDHLDDIDVTAMINPIKDVDGFGENSIVEAYKGETPFFTPCTPKGILELFDHYNINVEGKHVVVIGRSLIVGRPLSLLLQNRCATVTICHKKTKDLKKHTQSADIVISATGNPKMLTKEYFKGDNSQVVVDIGINKDENGKTCGDVDFENVQGQVEAITPVPGGVGPLTVLSLMENLVKAASLQSKE